MLRVGLTGGLASGKSTVAGLLRALGAELIEADELGRALMEPGQSVYRKVIDQFGPSVVLHDGRLDRACLARLAFAEGRLNELNAIVHPAVIEAQQQWMQQVFARDPEAIAVVESALIFEVVRDARARGETTGPLANWRERMDRVVLVTAPEATRVARYVERVARPGDDLSALAEDARRRLAHQIPDSEKIKMADEVIENNGNIDDLQRQVEAVWQRLRQGNN